MKISNEYINIEKIQEINIDEYVYLFNILSADEQEEFLDIFLTSVNDNE